MDYDAGSRSRIESPTRSSKYASPPNAPTKQSAFKRPSSQSSRDSEPEENLLKKFDDWEKERQREEEEKERSKAIERLQNVNVDDILKKYTEQHLKLSNLSFTKYSTLLSSRGSLIVPVFPDIQISAPRRTPSQFEQPPRIIFSRRQQPFLSQNEVNHLTGRMVTNIISSPNDQKCPERGLFKNGLGRLPRIQSEATSPVRSDSFHFDDGMQQSVNSSNVSHITALLASSYSDQDLLSFQLKHNQDQIKQISKAAFDQRQKKTDIYLNKLKDRLKLLQSMPNVRVSPSLYQDERQYMIEREFYYIDPNEMMKNIKEENNQIQQLLEREKEKEKERQRELQEAQMKEQMRIVRNHAVYWYEIEQSKVKPDMREHTIMEYASAKIYLYGGLSHKVHGDFYQLDPEKFIWKKLNVEESPIIGRHQHVSCSSRKQLIIFGGERHFDIERKERECLNDLRIYNVETEEMRKIKAQPSDISARRAAAATVVGKTFIVHGGISTAGTYLKDMWSFDLSSHQRKYLAMNKWQSADIQESQIFKKGVAFHKCCNVINPDRKSFAQLYKRDPKEKISEMYKDWIKEEGIYFFGGQDSTFEPLASLYILKIDVRPLHWIIPETKGLPPDARYDHSMVYNELLGLLVIYGGRNDNFNGNDCFLSDICIFNVHIMCWCTVQVYGMPRPPRSGHSATQLEKKMIVYGGYNHNGFLSSDIHIMELESTVAKRLSEQEAKLLQRMDVDRTPSSRVALKQQEQIVEEKKKFLEKVETEKREQDQLKKQIDESTFKNINTYLPRPKLQFNETIQTIANKRRLQQEQADLLEKQNKVKKPSVHSTWKKKKQ